MCNYKVCSICGESYNAAMGKHAKCIFLIFPKTNHRISKGLSHGGVLGEYKTDCPLADEDEQMIANPFWFEPLYITRERERRINVEMMANMPRAFLE